MYHLRLTWCRPLCSRGKQKPFTRPKRCANARLKIASDGPDLHSGIEGGAVVEPMIDMFVWFVPSKTCVVIYTQIRVRLLATIIDSNRVVQIPGFCPFSLFQSSIQPDWFLIDDRVRPQTAEEKELYKLLSDVTQKPASLLSSRWREPSITIHNIEISGPKGRIILFVLSSRAYFFCRQRRLSFREQWQLNSLYGLYQTRILTPLWDHYETTSRPPSMS
jgi:hypothetical protein